MKALMCLAALLLIPTATPPSVSTVRWDYSGDYVEHVIFGELWYLNGNPMGTVFGFTWEGEVAMSTADLTTWGISTSYYHQGPFPESTYVTLGTVIEDVFDLPLRYVPVTQDPGAVPYFRTSWTDVNGLTHCVTTPLAGTTQSAIDRAWSTHQKLVALMQTVYPPAPPPPVGG